LRGDLKIIYKIKSVKNKKQLHIHVGNPAIYNFFVPAFI